MTETRTISIQYIDAPVEAHTQTDGTEIKGRKNFSIKDTNGSKYLVRPTEPNGKTMDLDVQLEIGHTYTCEVNADKYKNWYVNSAVKAEGSAPAVASSSPAPALNTGWAPAPDQTRNRSILCQTIIKAVAKPDGSKAQADAWIEWHDSKIQQLTMDNMEDSVKKTFEGAKVTGVKVSVNKTALLDEHFNFKIEPELWENNTEDVLRVVDDAFKTLEEFNVENATEENSDSIPTPLRSEKQLRHWWRDTRDPLAPLKKSNPAKWQEYKEWATKIKEVHFTEKDDEDI